MELEFKGLSCREPSTTLIDGSSTESNTKGILLRITIVGDWKLNEHVNNLCKKACQKLNALARLAPFVNLDKKKNNNESFYRIAIWILPISFDVP